MAWHRLPPEQTKRSDSTRLMSAHRELQRIKPAAATGVDLAVAAEALSAIVRKATGRKTEARGLRSIMEAILLDSMFDLPKPRGRQGDRDLSAGRGGHRRTALHVYRGTRAIYGRLWFENLKLLSRIFL